MRRTPSPPPMRDQGARYNASQAALVATKIDGGIVAMVGGVDYRRSQFNRATDSLRQPGSSFKIFVYSTAMEMLGYKPTTMVSDRPVCIGDWCPQNFERSFGGSMSLLRRLCRIDQHGRRQPVDQDRAAADRRYGAQDGHHRRFPGDPLAGARASRRSRRSTWRRPMRWPPTTASRPRPTASPGSRRCRARWSMNTTTMRRANGCGASRRCSTCTSSCAPW